MLKLRRNRFISGGNDRAWTKYCGFLDLSVDDFMAVRRSPPAYRLRRDQMNKRGMVAVLLIVVLLLSAFPMTTLAAPPEDFLANGVVTAIDTGIVKAAGNSGRWVVSERHVTGTITGDLNGEFQFSYHANVTADQAGQLSGTMTVGEQTLKLRGASQPVTVVQVGPGVYLPRIAINGSWNFQKGRGNGDFDAWMIFVPVFDEEGNMHVGYIVASDFTLTGKQ